MTDIRDGEAVPLRLPKGHEAYRQSDGQIAIWDGARHVLVEASGAGLKAALTALRLARHYEKEKQS